MTSLAFEALLAQQRAVEADPLFAIEGAPKPVESHPVCPSCGVCCMVPGVRFISISPAELWDIVEYLDTDLATLQRDYLRVDLPMSLRSPCAFLRREGERFLCGIYPVRPSVCRDFSHCMVLQDDPPDAPRLIDAAKGRFAEWLAKVGG